MSLHPLTTARACVYLLFRPLPEECRPAYAYRNNGVTVFAVDPRSTNRQVTEWAVDNLSVAEQNAVRNAYGAPEVGQGGVESWTNDELVTGWVPAALTPPEADPWRNAKRLRAKAQQIRQQAMQLRSDSLLRRALN